MIGMVIAVIALAAMCAIFAAQLRFYEKIANAWEHAVDLDHVKEWSKYKEFSKSEKTAVHKFGIYLIDSVRAEVWGEKDKEDNEDEWDTED